MSVAGAAGESAPLRAHPFQPRRRRRTRPAPAGTNGSTGGGGLFSPAPRRASRSPRLQRAAVRAAAMEAQKENRPQAARPPVSAGHAPSGARPGPAPSRAAGALLALPAPSGCGADLRSVSGAGPGWAGEAPGLPGAS